MDTPKWLLVLILLLPASLQGQVSQQLPPKPLVFLHVTVIDATGAPPHPDRMVIVKDGRIVSVSKSGTLAIPPGGEVIDETGRYLIPGLWDMHIHLAFENWEPFIQTVYFPMLIANGVTGVRDMAGDMPVLLDLRRKSASGQILAPRMVIAGRELSWLPQDAGQFSVLHPIQGRHYVDQLAKAGVDFIKVQDPLSRSVYFAVADEARLQKIPFVGHVPYSVTAAEASAAGQKSFEHLMGIPEGCSTKERELKHAESAAMVRFDPSWHDAEGEFFRAFETYDTEKAAALFALLKRNNTWQVPTLVEERITHTFPRIQGETDERLRYMPEVTLRWWDTYMSGLTDGRTAEDIAAGKKYFEREIDLARAMHRAGIKFLAGTDALGQPYTFPGFSLHEELELLVKAGLTPMEAIQTATRNPAEFLGLLDSQGTVEKGKIADLVVLEANPLDDIRNTRGIVAVVVRGRYLPKQRLQEMLADARTVANSSR